MLQKSLHASNFLCRQAGGLLTELYLARPCEQIRLAATNYRDLDRVELQKRAGCPCDIRT